MIPINANTKISALIKANKESIEAIASLSRPLEKLRNPLLRKMMASRVSIAEAAKMGGCSIQAFADVLAPLGFVFEQQDTVMQAEGNKAPQWLTSARIHYLDVRPSLAENKDPFKEIMQHFTALPEGEVLCIINTFVPYPLISLLEKRGVLSYAAPVASGEFHTWFLKQAPFNISIAYPKEFPSFPQEKIVQIDVRQLEMPGPMQAILQALETLPQGHALYVLHKKKPVYLLDDLAGQNYQVHMNEVGEGDVRLLIIKA